MSFTTLNIPSVITSTASNITSTGATLSGNVTSDGGAIVTERGFMYGTSVEDLAQTVQSGSGTGSFTVNRTSLNSGTTYYYKAYATNSVGTAYGEVLSFTTLALPVVTTTDISSIGSATATSGGNVMSDGGATVTARGVCWSTSQNPTTANSHTTNGTGVGSFISNITGLSLGTTYYVRAYATNSVGTSYGEQKTFKTLAFPIVATIDVSDITSTTAICGGNVTSDGGTAVTARGVCWSTAENPTIRDSYTEDGAGTGSFTSNLTELALGTTYYVRAYATNNVGRVYGEQKTFTTLNIPTVVTSAASNITSSGATLSGNVTANGGATVTERGFMYGTSAEDLTQTIQSGSGIGNYTADIIGLSIGTTYYYKAYAINSIGTTYGDIMSFTTLNIPSVITSAATEVTSTNATLNGNVTADGGATITERGFMYGTNANNLTQIVQSGSGTGSFTANLTGLSAGTTYYYKAYATNSVGTAYGEVMSFATLECNCGGSVPVTDYDGNTYGTVQIGDQCWMAQNLKTTHFANGTSISLGSSTSTTTAYRYNPNNNSSNVATYGYLYNWPAAMHGASSSSTNPSNVQGVCPNGWHLPSDAEWTQLTGYLSSQSEYQCGGTTTNIAKSLASTTGWNSSGNTCAVGNTPANNNSTGFGALPAGYYSGSYYGFGGYATFWSATESSGSSAYNLNLNSSNANVGRGGGNKNLGRSVRCVRD